MISALKRILIFQCQVYSRAALDHEGAGIYCRARVDIEPVRRDIRRHAIFNGHCIGCRGSFRPADQCDRLLRIVEIFRLRVAADDIDQVSALRALLHRDRTLAYVKCIPRVLTQPRPDSRSAACLRVRIER